MSNSSGDNNRTIGVIFTIGFIVGAIFNSSGIMGFVGGMMAGIMASKTYSVELPSEWLKINDEQRGYISLLLGKLQGTTQHPNKKN